MEPNNGENAQIPTINDENKILNFLIEKFNLISEIETERLKDVEECASFMCLLRSFSLFSYSAYGDREKRQHLMNEVLCVFFKMFFLSDNESSNSNDPYLDFANFTQCKHCRMEYALSAIYEHIPQPPNEAIIERECVCCDSYCLLCLANHFAIALFKVGQSICFGDAKSVDTLQNKRIILQCPSSNCQGFFKTQNWKKKTYSHAFDILEEIQNPTTFPPQLPALTTKPNINNYDPSSSSNPPPECIIQPPSLDLNSIIRSVVPNFGASDGNKSGVLIHNFYFGYNGGKSQAMQYEDDEDNTTSVTEIVKKQKTEEGSKVVIRSPNKLPTSLGKNKCSFCQEKTHNCRTCPTKNKKKEKRLLQKKITEKVNPNDEKEEETIEEDEDEETIEEGKVSSPSNISSSSIYSTTTKH